MTSLYLGANAKAQAICFALCLAAGIVVGVFALLYFKKGGFFEKVLVDFFATCTLGAGFILCIEFARKSSKEKGRNRANSAESCLVLPHDFLFARLVLT